MKLRWRSRSPRRVHRMPSRLHRSQRSGYQIYSVKDAAGNVTAQYTVFQHGATTYLLCAQSTGAMPQNYLTPCWTP